MRKIIPEKLKEHVLPFDWDVAAVWSLPALAVDEPIERYTYLLHLPLWSSVSGKGMLFDVSPMEVLNSPERYPHQARRTSEANEAFPIDTVIYGDRKWILDGMHRLAKAYLQGAKKIAVRTHPEEAIAYIRTPGNALQRNADVSAEL